MTYIVNDKEITNVLSLSGPDRYEHFVNRVADWEELWGLKDDAGWVTLANDEGEEGIPLWPHPEYAKMCANGPWEGNQPALIDLRSFIEKWLPGMEHDGMLVAVFPTPEGKGVFVLSSVLAEDLNEALNQYD